MYILGIETSCDETGIAIYASKQGIIANKLYSQIPLHAKFGGVVPELASRDHINKIIPLIRSALQEASLEINDLDGIAYTAGPGLVGALLVGSTIGKTLAYSLKIPSLEINHMEGHLLAPLMESNQPKFPFLALLVSGGHTQIFKVDDIGKYILLGESIDDAAGEAFDKTAKLLGLSYPGGPQIAWLAQDGIDKYKFTRPMPQGLNFSFSGLKTSAANLIKKETLTEENKKSIARAFENAVVDLLTYKCKKAILETGITELVIAGGVSANKTLRKSFTELMKSFHGKVFFPKLEFCTDNGAMIAHAGYIRLSHGEQNPELSINVYPKWSLEKLTSYHTKL